MRSGLSAAIATSAMIVAALACVLPPAGCLVIPANVDCPGDCLCYSTPASCPVGCDPTYDILPDGGGTGEFICKNASQVEEDAESLDSGSLPPCPEVDGSILDANAPDAGLPSGACSGTVSCSALVAPPDCPGFVIGWTCSCIAGAWACEITSASTTACAPDAALDAALDDVRGL